MAEEKLFFHECRAAGLVFKDTDEWMRWLAENKGDIRKSVAEHEGFLYTINDVCVNPHVIGHDEDNFHGWKVKTAKTQFGWIWGYDITNGSSGSGSPASYPSRYDNSAIFYDTEEHALQDALSFVIRQLECKPKTKDVSMLIYFAKKKRADIVHPQQELFKQ